uniref:Glycosyltransferase n=1 Tax=Tetraselmis sp. GSL018 TaxID=582737 RepID=A0A061SDG7_9CHLO|mmetsp:Transcript_38717/g.91719  ORF Transcript_38717/g.91719 Transcript_38717/m.91719 type:complete len:232 (-) Transcript_38717:346-1041(-)|eukprot:CAMPEP_0177592746 /NCGR_PEP_ID=MMETSP0419_2-20121207/8730_1 /TAXON_ID=582737 /ORGANISM="Tetraselmis sp., Strain GSL018" /LENGTH=231 /DNA_ID=CAMNT_0019083645 /DNA_START=818 /DNA_END=1513 /DNA_ORIENTATION=-
MKSEGVPVYLKNKKISEAQKGTGSNHAISALKFGIINEFLSLGWSVLLSDVDVVVVQDPFKHLYRDSDVEGMSDGFDERTAYGFVDGFDDPSMGWARYAQAIKHFNFNSGLFYLRANSRTMDLMGRLENRLSHQKYWDQTAYNEEIFFLSHGDYKSPQVTVRVMDIYKFMNSKTLFKFVRHRPDMANSQPVMVHINYHPNKHERMKGVIKRFLDGDRHALDRFPGGSEPGT